MFEKSTESAVLLESSQEDGGKINSAMIANSIYSYNLDKINCSYDLIIGSHTINYVAP